MTVKQELAASDRGAADYFAGNHMNPYLWSKEGDQFRAWITGYNAAKAVADRAATANSRCTCLGMPGTNDCKVHS